jgi:hypothetical protein
MVYTLIYDLNGKAMVSAAPKQVVARPAGSIIMLLTVEVMCDSFYGTTVASVNPRLKLNLV